jgi:DNA polymerase III epsilon subunit-like protein
VNNRIKVTKGVKRRSAVEQALLIRQDVLAVVASANSRVAPLRQVTDTSAVEVVWRALNESRHFSSFAGRRNYAFNELKSFINLAQGHVSFSSVSKYSDLLTTAHPFSAAPHAMTASALADAQMQWYLADPRISEEHAPLLASAFSVESTEEQRKYATTRLGATQEGVQAFETITAAFSGDGNSYWARRMRAMRQRRDRLGRFAEQGGGMRLLVRTGDGSVRWLTGRSVGAAADSNTFDVETPKGIVRVPASSAEGIEAYLPGKTKDGYSPATARTTAADESDIIAEADLEFVDSPAGWEAVENFQGNAGEKAFSDGVYTVAQTNNEYGSKSYRLIDENGGEVAKGDNWTSMLDESIKDALGGAETPSELTDDMLLSGLDEIANNETAGSLRDVASNIANFLRDGTAPSDRTPEQLAEQAKRIADAIAGDKETTNPNQKTFEKKFQGFEDDFRKGSEAITKKLGGQEIQQDKKEEKQPIAQLPKKVVPALEVPQGAYELEQGDYTPSGRVNEDSTDFTDDPETLATKFKPREIANALQEALIGDSLDRINGLGYGGLEFNEGIEEVSAEALYFALKKQGKNADKFVADTYEKGKARLDRAKDEEINIISDPPKSGPSKAEDEEEITAFYDPPKSGFIEEVKGEDVADALDRIKDIPEVSEVTPAKGEQPIEDVNTAEEDAQEEDPNYPALIEGLTEDELQSWVDSGFDHVPFLPSNEDIKLPEGYTQIDPNPVALEDITTVEEGDALNQDGFSVGWTNDPYVLAQNFDTQELIDNLEFSLEPREEGSKYEVGVTPFTYFDENGDEFYVDIASEFIRDALQLQGEDTNEILQEIADRAWAAQAENKPVASDVEEGRSSGDLSDEEMQAMMDGEGIEPELDKPEVPSGIITEAQPEPERIGEPNAERASRLNARADELASAGKPARASVYRLRGLRDGEGVRLYTSAGEGNVSLPVGNVETANSFTPSTEAIELMQDGGITPLTMHELKSSPENAAIFHQAITDAKNANEFGASVFIYTPEEYVDMRMFISADGKSGFALKGTDLVSVFKGDTQDKRVAHAMVPLATQEGAITADAFDTTLPEIYGDHGLKTVARLPWDDSQAPSDWNKDTFSDFNNGQPDVTFMAYDPEDTAGYTAGQGEMFSDYGDAVGAQKKVVVPEQAPREDFIMQDPPKGGTSKEIFEYVMDDYPRDKTSKETVDFIMQDPPKDGTLPEDIWGPNTESNLPSKASIVKFSAPVTSMQPGDLTIGDCFTITEVGTEPDSRGKLSVKGYFPGHPVQEKLWKNITPINFVRGIPEEDMPMSGNLPEIHKPQYGDFLGGSNSQEFKLTYARWRGMINAARARWSNKYDVASYEFDAGTDIHRVKVHANELKPGDVMADPTKGNFVIASVSDPNPNNPDHADAISQGLLVVKGYYPGHELQEKMWKPRQEGRNGREYKMEVIRNSELPDSGPLPAINQGEVIDGVYVRNTDPEFVKQYNQNIANAASLYNFPSDAPEVDYPQEVNPALREAPRAVPTREPRSPFEVSDPFAQGAFAQMLRDAGSWEQLRENIKGMTFTFFDYETTGLDPNTENPVQLGAVKIKDGVVVDRFNMYMNPGRPLEGWSKDNLKDGDGNPLSDDFLQQQASMADAHQAFADWAGADTILGAQNSRFDRRFLENALSNTGVDFTPTGYIDPQSLARAINADAGVPRKGVALGKLAEEYGVSLENWHSADADAEAAALIFEKLLDRAQAENLANGQFDVDAIAAKHAEDLAFYDSVTYPNYLRDLEAWNMAQAVENALAGQEVTVEQLIEDSKNTTPTITPESAEDIAGVKASKDLVSKPTRLGTAEWVLDDANTRPIDREDVRANSLEVGDFMRTRKGDRWSQVVGVEEVEENRFTIHRVDLETGEEFTSGPYWGGTRLDNVRRPISANSLNTGEEGDSSLTNVVEPSEKPAPRLEHSDENIDDFSAETTIEESGDGVLTATTKVFDDNGDLVGEQENIVNSVEEAQEVGDSVLRALHEDIVALTLEMFESMEGTKPTNEEKPSQISDITYPTQRSEEIVFDKDANAYRITIMQMPKRFGGGYEVGVFKDSGLSNWEEAPDIDNFQRFETLEDAKSAGKEISKSLQPEVKTPKKPARSKEQKQNERRSRIQDGAYLERDNRAERRAWTDRGDWVDIFNWVNPDGSKVPLDMSDPEQAGDLTEGRVFGQPATRIIDGGEAIRDTLSTVDVGEEALDEPTVFAPGTPIGDRIVRPHGQIDSTTVVDPNGREFSIELQSGAGFEGDPEHYNVIIRDPERNNIELAYQEASSRGEADIMYADLQRALAEGRVVYNSDPNFGQDIKDATAGDSSPFVTSGLLPGEEPFRVRMIGDKDWQRYSEENYIFADGQNQARLGDRVVHQYDGWNEGRGEGVIVAWETIENSGDRARKGYAYVAFADGSYGTYATDFLFLNGRGRDTEDLRFAPPVSDEARNMERPLLNIQKGIEAPRKFETTEKYTVEVRRVEGTGRGAGAQFKTVIRPYVSKRGGTGLSKGVAETRRAYQMWLDRQERVREYRERAGLPPLSERIVELADPKDRVLGPIWRRATGRGEEPTPTTPQVQTPTPTPTPEPSPTAISSEERTAALETYVQIFNADRDNGLRDAEMDGDILKISNVGDDSDGQVNIEWAENRQAYSLQAFAEGSPYGEIEYFDNLGGVTYRAKQIINTIEQENIDRASTTTPTPTTPQAPTPIPMTDEERTRALQNSADSFNVRNDKAIEASAGNKFIKLRDLSDKIDATNVATIEWDEDRKTYSVDIESDFDSLETEYISNLDVAIARAEFRLLDLRPSREGDTPTDTDAPDVQTEAYQKIINAGLQAPGSYAITNMSTVDENLKGVFWTRRGYENSSSGRAVSITATPEGKFRTSAWLASMAMQQGRNPDFSDDFDTLNEAAAQANLYLAGANGSPSSRGDSGPAGANPQVLPGNPITEAPNTYAYIQDLESYPSRAYAVPGARQNLSVSQSSATKEINMTDRVTGTQGMVYYETASGKYVATADGVEFPNKFDTVDDAGDAVIQKFLEKREAIEVPRSTGGTASRPYPLAPREKRLNAREVANLKSAIEGRLAALNASAPVEVSIASDDNSFTGLSYKISVPSVEHEMILTQDTSQGGWTLSSLNTDGTIKNSGRYRRTEEALDRINLSSRNAVDGYHMARVQAQRTRMQTLQQELKDYVPNSRASARVDSAGSEGTWDYGFTHKPAGYVNEYRVDVNIDPKGENTAIVTVVSPDGTMDSYEIPSNANLDTVLESVKTKVDELATTNSEESLATKRARADAKAEEILEAELNLQLAPNPIPLHRRFLNIAKNLLTPVQQIEFDGSMAGVSNPNFDRIDDNFVVTPNGDPVTQKHFQDQGWEAEKAAQIAHAGVSRPSIDRVIELIRSGDSRELNKAVALGMGVGNVFGGDLTIEGVSAGGRINSSGTGNMDVSVRIKSTETGKTYSASRQFRFVDGKLDNVYNASMFIEGAKPSGFSSLFNQYAENWYIANGAKSITVSAAAGGFSHPGSATGGYVWAITGFNWNGAGVGYNQLKSRYDYIQRGYTSGERVDYYGSSTGYARAKASMDKVVQQAFDAYGVSDWEGLRQAMTSDAELAPTFPTPREMAMIGWTPDLRANEQHWFGKAYSMDTGFSGKKTLIPTSTERVQNSAYENMKKAIDKLAASGANAFENNEKIKSHFATRSTYDGIGEILAPYADELTQLTGYEGKRSVSQLSPPAKAALGKYLATILADGNDPVFTNGDSPSDKAKDASIKADFVSMLDALQRDRLSFEPNRTKLSEAGETVKNLPSEVFDTSMTPGETKNVTNQETGEILPFTITKLVQQNTTSPEDGPTISGAYAGASDIWLVQSTKTEERFFVKNVSTETNVQSEIASNIVGRALGIVGLPVVDRQGDANSTRIITSELGTNLSIPSINSDELVVGANSSPELDTPHLVRMSESGIFDVNAVDVASHVSINNALGILAMDAIIQNNDRGSNNVMMVRGNDVPNTPVHENVAEAWIPIPFDHADAVAIRTAIEQTSNGYQSPYDYLTTSLGVSNDLGKQIFDRVGPVTFKMLMDKRIAQALQELKSRYSSGYMPQDVLDMISDRASEILNYTTDNWSDIYG